MAANNVEIRLKKCLTGIDGLDAITYGGLPLDYRWDFDPASDYQEIPRLGSWHQ